MFAINSTAYAYFITLSYCAEKGYDPMNRSDVKTALYEMTSIEHSDEDIETMLNNYFNVHDTFVGQYFPRL